MCNPIKAWQDAAAAISSFRQEIRPFNGRFLEVDAMHARCSQMLSELNELHSHFEESVPISMHVIESCISSVESELSDLIDMLNSGSGQQYIRIIEESWNLAIVTIRALEQDIILRKPGLFSERPRTQGMAARHIGTMIAKDNQFLNVDTGLNLSNIGYLEASKNVVHDKRVARDNENYNRRIKKDILDRSQSILGGDERMKSDRFDFFISHASEDKNDFVRALAHALQALGASVFYDETTLRVGDSLRRKIDKGLAGARFGVVVLSEHFFNKEWPQRELDGLVARENQGAARILPIWHKISKDEVAQRSPTLADKVALNTATKSADQIARDLYTLLDPKP